MEKKLDEAVILNAMDHIIGIRRGQLEALLPFSLVFGFNVIPSTTAPGPTILLPPEDYALFEALYNGPEGDAVRAMTVSAADPAQPPKGDATDAEGLRPSSGPSEALGSNFPHLFYRNTDRDIPPGITDGNGVVVLDQCRICGAAEGDLAPTCPGPGPITT